MQFTRLIASKAMTDSVATANLKMLHHETEVAATPTRVHRSSAYASMTMKIWTTVQFPDPPRR
jgi:hypothetical protein